MKWFHIAGDINESIEFQLFSFVAEMIHRGEKELTVSINSIGGNLDTGTSIYSLLRSKRFAVTTYVTGTCQSAAVLIFLAGDQRIIHPSASIATHGPARKHDRITLQVAKEIIKSLEGDTESMLSIFVERLGKDRDSVLQYVSSECRLNAHDALQQNFATKISDLGHDDHFLSNVN